MKTGSARRAMAKKVKTQILIILKGVPTFVSNCFVAYGLESAVSSPLALKLYWSQKTDIRAIKLSSITNLSQNPQNIPAEILSSLCERRWEYFLMGRRACRPSMTRSVHIKIMKPIPRRFTMY